MQGATAATQDLVPSKLADCASLPCITTLLEAAICLLTGFKTCHHEPIDGMISWTSWTSTKCALQWPRCLFKAAARVLEDASSASGAFQLREKGGGEGNTATSAGCATQGLTDTSAGQALSMLGRLLVPARH